MAAMTDPAIDWQTVAARVTGLLRNLIRIDTSNPPGNETPAARYVAEALAAAGIPAQVAGRDPARCNVVARLRGSGRERPLLLLSHLDVVTAQPEHWTYPPFAGVLDERGIVYGRGATDCKGLVAQQVMVLLLLRESGVPLDRDVILAATADEESPDPEGIIWLLAEHPDWLEAEYCLNEGGGEGYRLGDRTYYACQVGEKGLCPLRLTARGQAGHGSVPIDDNAIVHLARAIERLACTPLPIHHTAATEAFLAGLGDRLPLLAAQEGAMIEAMRRNTAAPTLVRAGHRLNVIPDTAEARLDCRVLPGQTEAGVLAEVRAALDGLPVTVEAELFRPGVEFLSSPMSVGGQGSGDALYGLIEAVVRDHDPEGVVLPFLQPGTTDGHYLAEAGAVVYGFFPLRPEPGINYAEMAHATDERISVANLTFGTRVLFDVVRRFCGAG